MKPKLKLRWLKTKYNIGKSWFFGKDIFISDVELQIKYIIDNIEGDEQSWSEWETIPILEVEKTI